MYRFQWKQRVMNSIAVPMVKYRVVSKFENQLILV